MILFMKLYHLTARLHVRCFYIRYDLFGKEDIQGSSGLSSRHYYTNADAERLFRTVFGDDFRFGMMV